MKPNDNEKGSFILEAKVNMAMTFGRSDPDWHSAKIGDQYSIQIVHTDPDGKDYGAHLILYGEGDNYATWKRIILSGPAPALIRKAS